MKIRNGFVSNSSSTSFYLMGVMHKDKDEPELIKGSNLCVEYACNECDDSIYIGLPPESMKEDETLRQFKQRIFDELNKIFPDEFKIEDLSWITDGGYNG